MTKENRERQYLNFRKTEKEYQATEGMDKGSLSTNHIKQWNKNLADRMLARYPELAELDKPKPKPKNVKKS